MRIGSLFAGIGGFDLAARWVGWETAWYSEIEPYACRVMEKNFPGVPNLGDITEITSPPPVNVLAGGFPCQDISLAGKGAGIEGSRSGLWAHYARLIGGIQPRWVLAENVSALRSRGLDRVLQDLAALGYDAEWHCVPASAVGAPHQRDRIWVLAYPHGQRQQEQHVTPVSAFAAFASRGCDAIPTHSAGIGLEGGIDTNPLHGEAGCVWTGQPTRSCAGNGAEPREWTSEPDVGRVANGVPSRVDRLRCLGNAIVPQVALLFFRAIQRYENNR